MSDTGSTPPTPLHPTTENRSTGRRVLLNTGSLAGSSLWRIFISFVLQVLITRALGVEAFGQYVSALAFLNVAQVISELGLSTLLVRDLAPAPAQRRDYFRLALRLQGSAAFLTWGGLLLLSVVLPLSPVTRNAMWLVGASLPLYAVTSAAQTLFKAAERMELVMAVEATINTLIMALSIGVLVTGGGVVPLIGVMVVTQAVSALLCLWLLRRARLLAAPQERRQVDLRLLWREMRSFYWLSLADVLLHRLDILLLNVVAGDYVTGVYSIAYSVVRVLVKLIQSYWQALYPTLSRLRFQAERQYQRLSMVSLRYGLMLVLPAAAIGTGVAGEALTLLYRDKAMDSIRVFQLLLWMTPFFLIEMYGIIQLMVEHRTHDSLIITWYHIGAVALLLPPLTYLLGAVGAALAMVTASAVGASGALVLAMRRGVPFHLPKLPVLLGATGVALVGAVWLPLPWLGRAVVAGLVYLAIVWATGVFSPDDRQIVRNLLKTPV